MIKIDMIERNLLERTCDVRWWALEKAFWQCITLADDQKKGSKAKAGSKTASSAKALKEAVELACTRLEDIRNSYTLYRDLVIADIDGTIIANSNGERRSEVLGMNVSDEEWFRKALETKDGTEYFVQDVSRSKLEDIDSLIYSTALRADGDEQGEVIRAMGVLFDFQGESQIILNDYLPKDGDGQTLQGWFSFFTNQSGRVICSSDESLSQAVKSPTFHVTIGTFRPPAKSSFRRARCAGTDRSSSRTKARVLTNTRDSTGPVT